MKYIFFCLQEEDDRGWKTHSICLNNDIIGAGKGNSAQAEVKAGEKTGPGFCREAVMSLYPKRAPSVSGCVRCVHYFHYTAPQQRENVTLKSQRSSFTWTSCYLVTKQKTQWVRVRPKHWNLSYRSCLHTWTLALKKNQCKHMVQ